MKTLKNAALWLAMSVGLASPLGAANGNVRIIQTNSAGDNVHIIDPATNTIVGEIKGIERNHGVAVTPDGAWIFVSNEADNTVDVASGKTFNVEHRIPLSGHPNNISITPDGRKVYVAIASAGIVDILDTATMKKVKSISVHGAVHNTYVTPDGKFAVASMIGARQFTVIDSKTDLPLWAEYFEVGVRPMMFSTNPDGSTKWAFVQLTDFNGFAVVDWDARKEIRRITLPELPPGETAKHVEGNQSHGMIVTPDQKIIVVNSALNGSIYFYSLPDLKLLGRTRVGMDPDWITITPDGKTVYAANSSSNDVSAVDVKSMKEITKIKVGQVPKRNIAAILP